MNQNRFDEETNACLVILSFINEGKASQWATKIIAKIISGDYTGKTCADFWKDADAVFNPPNSKNDVAISLEQLMQGKMSAEEYFIEFDFLAERAGYADKARDAFKKHLACRCLSRPLWCVTCLKIPRRLRRSRSSPLCRLPYISI